MKPPLTYSEMEARDRRAELGHDGREQIPDSACPCGRPVVEVEERFDMIGGRNNRHLILWHNRVDYCHFRRVF